MKDFHTGGKKWPCVGQAGSTRKARELEIQEQSYSSIHVDFVTGSKIITYPVRLKYITFFPDNGQHQADVIVHPWWHFPPFLVGSLVSPSIIAGTNCLVSRSNQVGKSFNFAMILSQEYSLHLRVDGVRGGGVKSILEILKFRKRLVTLLKDCFPFLAALSFSSLVFISLVFIFFLSLC